MTVPKTGCSASVNPNPAKHDARAQEIHGTLFSLMMPDYSSQQIHTAILPSRTLTQENTHYNRSPRKARGPTGLSDSHALLADTLTLTECRVEYMSSTFV